MNLVYSIDNIQEVAKEIISNFPEQRCFAFYAEMGSGKTTLIRALCDALGVEDNVSSPTFSLINEYKQFVLFCREHIQGSILLNMNGTIREQKRLSQEQSHILCPDITASIYIAQWSQRLD
jgi:energy-coupling factor transporter ATP-binding protein EcfA2